MNRNHVTTGSRDTSLEDFAAELTEAAYPVVLQHGVGDRWLDLELDLWKVLANTVQEWCRQRSPGEQRAPLRS
jgi:hypothetical protein